MSFYGDAAQTVLEQITEFGQTIPIKRVGGSLNGATGVFTETGLLAADLKGLILSLSKTDRDKLSDKYTESLQLGKMRKVLAAALNVAFQPEPVDILVFDSNNWRIIALDTLNPAGTPLLYTIIVEQAQVETDLSEAIDVIALEEAVEGLETFVES